MNAPGHSTPIYRPIRMGRTTYDLNLIHDNWSEDVLLEMQRLRRELEDLRRRLDALVPPP